MLFYWVKPLTELSKSTQITLFTVTFGVRWRLPTLWRTTRQLLLKLPARIMQPVASRYLSLSLQIYVSSPDLLHPTTESHRSDASNPIIHI